MYSEERTKMLTRIDRDLFCELTAEQEVRLEKIESVGDCGDVRMMLCDEDSDIAMFVCNGADQSIHIPTGGFVNNRLLKYFAKWSRNFSRHSAKDWATGDDCLTVEDAVGEMYIYLEKKKKAAVPVKIKVLGVDAEGFEWELPSLPLWFMDKLMAEGVVGEGVAYRT